MQIPERIDLFEIHEQSWLPENLKSLFREMLSWEQEMVGVYREAAGIVIPWLKQVKSQAILDLCSGAGGPILTLKDSLEQAGSPVQVKLSDLYPPLEIYQTLAMKHQGVEFHNGSFDASNSVFEEKFRARTILSAFHHFSPGLAAKILADAAENSDGICIIDPFQRDLFHAFLLPLGTAALAPLFSLAHFSPQSLLFNNVLPLGSALFGWDGFASVLRGYTPDELLQMTREFPECAQFQWQAGNFSYGPGFTAVYLTGVRK